MSQRLWPAREHITPTLLALGAWRADHGTRPAGQLLCAEGAETAHYERLIHPKGAEYCWEFAVPPWQIRGTAPVLKKKPADFAGLRWS